MIKHLYYILKSARPRQWIKNLALFAAITFGGELFNFPILFQVGLGFISFCLLSSSTYILNDLLDVKKDRLHPFKRSRPIASGKIGRVEAIALFILLFFSSLLIAKSINNLFFLITLFYLSVQISYSFVFKSIVVFDILLIALGYILRVLSGEVISTSHIPVWLLLTTISLSLFLAVGKRRSELTLLKSVKASNINEVRGTLSHYSENLLDAFSTMFATSTFIMYSLFTFQESPTGFKPSLPLLLVDFLPTQLQRKWLMITTIPVVYGLMRYMQDIYEKQEGESPERVLLSDKSLLGAVVVWVLLVIIVIYFI